MLPGFALAGGGSTRYRNLTLASIATSAFSMPPSKRAGLSAFAVELHERRQILLGHADAGKLSSQDSRGCARRMPFLLFGSGARQTKMRVRLGVSTGSPVGLNGPFTVIAGPGAWALAGRAAVGNHAAHDQPGAGVAGSRRARNKSKQLAFALGETAARIRRDDRVKSRRQVSASLGVDARSIHREDQRIARPHEVHSRLRTEPGTAP